MINKNICFHSGRKENKPFPFRTQTSCLTRELRASTQQLSTQSTRLRPTTLTVPKPTDSKARCPSLLALSCTLCAWKPLAHRDPDQRAGSLRLPRTPSPPPPPPSTAEPRFCSEAKAIFFSLESNISVHFLLPQSDAGGPFIGGQEFCFLQGVRMQRKAFMFMMSGAL